MAALGVLIWALVRSKPAPTPSHQPVVQAPRGNTTPIPLSAPVRIRPEAAGQHFGERVIVEFQVKYVGKASTAERYFLNSMRDYRDQSNFTVTFAGAVLNQLKEKGITNVPGHFENKTIRVTGTVTQYSGRPQIEPEDLNQIEMVGS